jgi:predicted DNA-binding transcriptional regulator AlpA
MNTVAPDFRIMFRSLDPDAVIDAEEFSQLLRINRQGIYHRLHKKELVAPVIHRNRLVRWRVSDVRDFLRGLAEVRKVKPDGKRVGRPRSAGHVAATSVNETTSLK